MTDTTDPKIAALQFVANALNDFTNTLPVSVRASFIKEAQAAIKALESEAPKAEQ